MKITQTTIHLEAEIEKNKNEKAFSLKGCAMSDTSYRSIICLLMIVTTEADQKLILLYIGGQKKRQLQDNKKYMLVFETALSCTQLNS